ncbi:MAG: hypothetical protein U0350_45470 [Caldilineaceae bacterium]
MNYLIANDLPQSRYPPTIDNLRFAKIVIFRFVRTEHLSAKGFIEMAGAANCTPTDY